MDELIALDLVSAAGFAYAATLQKLGRIALSWRGKHKYITIANCDVRCLGCTLCLGYRPLRIIGQGQIFLNYIKRYHAPSSMYTQERRRVVRRFGFEC